MSWNPTDTMTLKKEFIHFARQEGANVSLLCRRYQISRKTGYKWLKRYEEQGAAGLEERSRRPGRRPGQTGGKVAQSITALRREHPAWGARKLRAVLQREGVEGVPCASAVHAVLRREGLISAEASGKARAWQRFAREAPNELWQMDFKGHFGVGTRGARCHPLTMLDDCSRFNLVLEACAGETRAVVQEHLSRCFMRYGLPLAILCDNGSPWGCAAGGPRRWTGLEVWLMRAGVRVLHGRPYHPQTQGKEERFHRTLEAEVLGKNEPWRDLADVQRAFDRWREIYNGRRPHEMLDQQRPSDLYVPSSRSFTGVLPEVASYYPAGDKQRNVRKRGQIAWGGRRWYIGESFAGHPVALRPTEEDGVMAVWFCCVELGRIALRREKAGKEAEVEELAPPKDAGK